MSDAKQSLIERILVPVIISAIMSAFTGYMGSMMAIAVLEEKVSHVEITQVTNKAAINSRISALEAQQQADGRGLVRIETKVDLLLTRPTQ